MPVIHVNLLEGRSTDAKRALAADVTQAVCRHLGVKPAQVRVIFHDVRREDWSVGGVLYSDRDDGASADLGAP
ncbi:MAG: tautomerase family protein [Synergistaceae bacterium]|jgi:4-oxalocrotonate tautomerase|nr:tautomerase family protein [Synergistaceae bacterium]